MKEIKLGQCQKGKYSHLIAQVDDEDFAELSKYNWTAAKSHKTYYAMRKDKFTKKNVFMHHAIIGKPPLNMVTDHKNRNGLDNQRHNLRHCTYLESTLNRGKFCMLNQKTTFVVQKTLDGEIVNIFPSINEAAKATGANVSSVWKCVSKKAKTTKGFTWEEFNISKNKKRTSRPVRRSPEVAY